ncbi:CRE-UNC-61 protein [Caenorhabditis remanei]|uniref:CRE-UNC-61 protein n=1 Tax=Caenorhabditis remanei TaxID=31234 RepID=E3MNA5_CAERE|nr:CRE-UNC-61 protein [Caenorhabditis remanei]
MSFETILYTAVVLLFIFLVFLLTTAFLIVRRSKQSSVNLQTVVVTQENPYVTMTSRSSKMEIPVILPKKFNMTDTEHKHLPPHNPPPPVPHHHHTQQTHSTHHNNSTTISSATSSINTTSTASKKPAVAAPAAPLASKAVGVLYFIHFDIYFLQMDTVGRVMQLNGHVGFDSLPHQLVKKAVEAGFQFNLMCVGETGMGKTTLIESLFNMKLDFEPCNHELKTVELRTKTYDVAEGGIRVKLRLVETAGFGDQLDKDKSAKVIVDYLESQFEKYLQEELKPRRMLQYFDDSRIHACLYFISPTGHGLKALDLVTLRELAKRVNVIPVIAKSDTTCKDELLRFKKKILSELKSQKIEIYSFPTDDETVSTTNQAMNTAVPFAVVGSCDFVKKENGQMVRARQYPWGIVEVENEQHCDFVKLREALLRTNVDEMRQRTHESLYENYRRDRLRQMKIGDGETGPKIIEKLAQRRFQKHREYQDEFSRRELSLREEFQKKLDHTEADMRKMEEALAAREREVQGKHEQEAKKLDAEIRQLTEERMKLMAKVSKKLRK